MPPHVTDVNSESSTITTMGEILDDGTVVEQVAGNQLLLCADATCRIAPVVHHRQSTYVPAVLDSQLSRTLRLPARPESYGGVKQLISDIRDPLVELGVGRDASLPLSIALGATWVPECLRHPVVINLWGAYGATSGIVDVITCIARRALRLAHLSVPHLAIFPAGLNPTLILVHPSEATLESLVLAAGEPDTCFVFGRRLVQVHCPVLVAITSKPTSIASINVPLWSIGRGTVRLTPADMNALVDRFQSRLLAYRLSEHVAVANSRFDLPQFAPQTRLLGQTLGAAVQGSRDLQNELATALAGVDEQRKERYLPERTAVVLQALAHVGHRNISPVYVATIADVANSFMVLHGNKTGLAARAVGPILRDELGIATHRTNIGVEVHLGQNAQVRVHQLAFTYGVLDDVPECALCQDILKQ